jgi:hypothetical protein
MKEGVISGFAAQSYRTILHAYKDISADDWELFVN